MWENKDNEHCDNIFSWISSSYVDTETMYIIYL